MRKTLSIILLAQVTILCASAPSAEACSIDGKPSAFANGERAVLTRDTFTGPTPATWSPFSFARHQPAHAAIQFAEDVTQVRRALPAAATRVAWRWEFGDSATAVGWSMTHRYARPGAYLIVVSAYYPAWHRYYAFDDVRMTIVR